MRSSHWCVTLVTLIAFATSLSAFAQGQVPPNTGRPPAGQPAAQPAASSNAAQQRGTTVAVVDIKFIFENHARFKTAMESIKKDYEAFEAQVRGVEGNLRKQIEQLKTMQAGSPEFRQLETEIATKRTQVQLDINNRQKERVEEEAQVYHNAYKELEGEIKTFANRYGIDLVLQYSSAEIDPSKPDTVIRGLNRMVVYENQLNITQHILQALNARAPTQVAPVNPQPQRTAVPPSSGPGAIRTNPGGVPSKTR